MMEKKKKSASGLVVSSILRYLVATVSLSIIMYIVFALVFSTKEEQLLQKENGLYRARYEQMLEKERVIAGGVDALLAKDNAIYSELFETEAPSLDALTAVDVIASSDSLSESFYLSAAASASERLMLMADNVDDNFEEIFRMVLGERKDSIPPLSLPLHDMSYIQTGASVGMKYNPSYHLPMQHDGIDFIASQGAPVYAAADGIVSEVVKSRRGLGNIVVIDHGNGYKTRYCLLGEVLAVKGRSIKRDQQIGTVGITPMIPAPHLHFEVLHNGTVCDPVNFLFASLSPEDYSRMVYMAASTAQSMD